MTWCCGPAGCAELSPGGGVRRDLGVRTRQDVLEQARMCGVPVQQLPSHDVRGGRVQGEEDPDPAEVLPRLIGRDGLRADAERGGNRLGDIASRHAGLAYRV